MASLPSKRALAKFNQCRASANLPHCRHAAAVWLSGDKWEMFVAPRTARLHAHRVLCRSHTTTTNALERVFPFHIPSLARLLIFLARRLVLSPPNASAWRHVVGHGTGRLEPHEARMSARYDLITGIAALHYACPYGLPAPFRRGGPDIGERRLRLHDHPPCLAWLHTALNSLR